jgi:hypothetical protein
MGRHRTRPAPNAPFMCWRCSSPRVVDFDAEVVCSQCGAVTRVDASEISQDVAESETQPHTPRSVLSGHGLSGVRARGEDHDAQP